VLTDSLAIRGQLDALATLLGPPFEPPKPLECVAGPSRIVGIIVPPNGLKRRSSTMPFHPRPSSDRKVSTVLDTVAVEACKSEAWMDVGEAVMEALEADLQKAIEERVSHSHH
jgi:protein regulator of cytokinesis 1